MPLKWKTIMKQRLAKEPSKCFSGDTQLSHKVQCRGKMYVSLTVLLQAKQRSPPRAIYKPSEYVLFYRVNHGMWQEPFCPDVFLARHDFSHWVFAHWAFSHWVFLPFVFSIGFFGFCPLVFPGANVSWDGSLVLTVAERLSSSELRCHVEEPKTIKRPLPRGKRGMVFERSMRTHCWYVGLKKLA